jgi:ATPase components of various ABC-type transport systems, contain duplicated ATPase
MADRTPVIAFSGFSFKYRAQTEPTLRNINLEIYPGEKVLIAGPSGSGKSTLARCINGLVPCAWPGDITGTLSVCGYDPAQAGIFGMSKKVGTVLQDTDGQFIGLTVGEDIAFALENDCTGQNEMRGKVEKAAALVGVEQLLAESPGSLSGGQKQRVSMAGVLVDDVDVLLFDEPLANLDPAAGKRAIELIDRLQKNQHKTVIIIEHRLEDVLWRDADRIIVIGDGTVAADMTPDELLCTDILSRHGIREPLYIAALKHAGCTLRPCDKPQHVETMNIEPYREQVCSWFSGVHVPPSVAGTEHILDVQHVSFSYDGTREVLHDVSFSLKKGEMTSIVGQNGAGKSTVASLICGFETPGRGSILLNGQDIAPLSVKERGEKIGFVMQNPNQMISCPLVSDEVALGLKVRGTDAADTEKRVNETLRTCGLYPFRHWPVSALSFGQKKRVTIAAILVLQPEIIILDEPTAGQDFRRYTDIMDFLETINRKLGITILMITHDMHLMLEYTRRALVMSGGRLAADGKSPRILSDGALTDTAHLKKTSLYDLAVRCGIDRPDDFIDTFIFEDRRIRAALHHDAGGTD